MLMVIFVISTAAIEHFVVHSRNRSLIFKHTKQSFNLSGSLRSKGSNAFLLSEHQISLLRTNG